jgi:hypothetical protein
MNRREVITALAVAAAARPVAARARSSLRCRSSGFSTAHRPPCLRI